MEIRLAVNEFQKTLTQLQGVIQKKNTMPVLANVLLEAQLDESGIGSLSLSGTDLDTGMRTSQSCDVMDTGAITISAKALLDVVKVLPGPSVTLKLLSNQQVNVRSSHTSANLFALSAEEFPGLPETENLRWQKMNVPTFLEMIQRTLYSASVDENRYNLTGVYFEPSEDEDGRLVMVATDGHRLSRIAKTMPEGRLSTFRPVIMPRKGLSELIRLLENQQIADGEDFFMAFSEKHAHVSRGNVLLSMRLIDGQFPDYNQVIPKLADKILRASRQSFLTSVKRVSVLASDKNQCIKFSAKKDDVRVSCINPDAGEVEDSIPVEYNGPELELGFNAKYVLDALSSITDDNVLVKFTDPLSPSLLSGVSDDSHVCVIMPMRI